MTAGELVEVLEARPFQPLRLRLADGRIRELRRPEMAIVSDAQIAIGIPRDEESLIATKIVRCSLPEVTGAEPIAPGS